MRMSRVFVHTLSGMRTRFLASQHMVIRRSLRHVQVAIKLIRRPLPRMVATNLLREILVSCQSISRASSSMFTV